MEDRMTYFYEVYGTLPRAGPGDDASTRRAFEMMKGLPEEPRILDIGCGPGKQTLELARLSKGKIIALDNHQPFLDRVNEQAKSLGLSPYTETLNKDMKAMDFPPGSFDVIWSEGALYLMGFENGLKTCRQFLKPKGYIGVTELVWLTSRPTPEAREWAKEYPAMKDVPETLMLFPGAGYTIIGHFTLPVYSWLKEYYDPMQKRVDELRSRYEGNVTATDVLEAAQREITGFKKCWREVGYEFFVARAE